MSHSSQFILKEEEVNILYLYIYIVVSVYLGTSLPVHLRGSPGETVPGAGGGFGFRPCFLGQDPSAQVRSLDLRPGFTSKISVLFLSLNLAYYLCIL